MLEKSRIKYIQSLSQKKAREAEAVFVAEGPKIINELLEAPNLRLKHLYGTTEWLNRLPAAWQQRHPGKFTEISDKELERISSLSTPNQVCGIFEMPVFPGLPDWTRGISLLLDGIQDPGNLGTIVRCADWFGVQRIVCSPNSADLFSFKVVQATMGSITRVRVIYSDLVAFIRNQSSVPVYASALEGKPLDAISKPENGFLLIGNESKGIASELMDLAKEKITIPRKGGAESLNAAIAAGILLYHLT